MGENAIVTKEDIMNVLDICYQKALDGIPVVSDPIDVMAKGYLDKEKDPLVAATSMVNYQIAKCTTSGFITGLGGAITMPVAIPANLSSVLYVQIRMIACTAYIAGYDLKSDQVQTLVYACLAGIALNQVLKDAGIKIGVKVANNAVHKISGEVIKKINQKVGCRLLTKFGEKGVINIGNMIPIVGAAINAGADFYETRIIGNRSLAMFFNGDFSGDNDEILQERNGDFCVDKEKRVAKAINGDKTLKVNGVLKINGKEELSNEIRFPKGGCVYKIALKLNPNSASLFRYEIEVEASGPSGMFNSNEIIFRDATGDKYSLSIWDGVRKKHIVDYNSDKPEIVSIEWR